MRMRPIMVIALCLAAAGATAAELSDIRWLLGDWQTEPIADGTRYAIESWQEVSPLTFEGCSETRCALTDTLIELETARIVEMSGEAFYIAKLPEDPRPVSYTLSGFLDDRIEFSNPKYDFPQRILYRTVGKDSLRIDVLTMEGDGYSVGLSKLR